MNSSADSETTLCDPDYESSLLVHAILAGDVAQVTFLAMLGMGISTADSWIIYDACLQGTDMLHALLLNPAINLNPVLDGQSDTRMLHLVLRTPSERFQSPKEEVMELLLQQNGFVRDASEAQTDAD